MAEVDWAIDARVDLRLIRAYIARDSPKNARVFADRLVTATKRLQGFPRSGRVVPELQDELTRELIVGSYRIVYRVFAARATIVAVIHARQDIIGVAGERGWPAP